MNRKAMYSYFSKLGSQYLREPREKRGKKRRVREIYHRTRTWQKERGSVRDERSTGLGVQCECFECHV